MDEQYGSVKSEPARQVGEQLSGMNVSLKTITPKKGIRIWIKRLFCKHKNLRNLDGHYTVGAWRTCQQCKNCEMFKLHL